MEMHRVLEASQVLSWLSEQAGQIREDDKEAVTMALTLTAANSYLAEYMAHMNKGQEPYDALVATIRGELRLTETQRDLLRATLPPRST